MSALGLPFDLIERHPDVGGIWDIRFPGSPMYESAHFISSKTLSAFRDFPMPDSYPDYPSHRQVLEYLHGYADRHGLRAHAQFGAAVREARPAEDGSWTVVMEKGETRQYAGVILAIGQQWTPKMPGAAARFEGEAYHSSAYGSARQLDGKRVLVVGGGNSGCDIAVDAGQAAAKAFLSLRRGYWFVPKHLFGLPADVFGARGPHLPYWLERRIDERLLRLLLGDLRRLGLPAPDHRLFETHPVLNSQLLGSLAHGEVVVKPDVREFRGRRVVFADGSEEDVDVVIFATGYRRRFPVLPESVHHEGDVACLYLNLCHRTQPGLFVVGFFETDGGAFPLIDLQCELVARVIQARRSQPKKARRFQKRLEAPPPDLTGGVRYLQVERRQNYVRSRPSRRARAAAIKDLS
jgi:cation diffusion facilitator CzcD-associated flavoprotein CzcO